jgi:hypothetical protein
MASEVGICNLALAHLGDEATVTSINPPEGSAQAEHCQRFYPIARDGMLQMHNWNFASRRVLLAQVTQPWDQWQYAYAAPGDMMVAVSVLPPESDDDYTSRRIPADQPGWAYNYTPIVAAGMYVPQAYSIETDSSGNKVIYTNQKDALLRYQALVTDSTKFDPLFTIALSHYLASMLAGPVLKGDAGAAESKRQLQLMLVYLQQARASDANQRNIKPEHLTSWISGR